MVLKTKLNKLLTRLKETLIKLETLLFQSRLHHMLKILLG